MTDLATKFEIKVALLGHVSVGKTTVLNALLQEKFSEVSKRQTTAGINFFKIITPQQTLPSSSNNNNGNTKRRYAMMSMDGTTMNMHEDHESEGAEEEDDDGDVPDMHHKNKNKTTKRSKYVDKRDDVTTRTATLTLTEITQDNKKLREQNNVIQEKTFHIEMKEPLVEMCDDTTLVLVDVPGLNEADSKKMYLNYVTKNWDTFDCVIIVMDAEKGVNTEEDVKLLQFVKSMLDSKKNIPIIILCNKVDDNNDEELMELVNEVQHKVEEIFDVGNQAKLLEQMLVAARQGRRCTNESLVYPIFLPLSAGNAFAYCMAAKCSLESVGGSNVQSDLLEKQTEVSLRKLSPDTLVAPQLRSAYEIFKALGRDPSRLKHAFRTAYDGRVAIAVDSFHDELNISKFNGLVDELIAYRDFASEIGWIVEEEADIANLMSDLVRFQITLVLQEEKGWKIDDAVIGQYSTTRRSLRQGDLYTDDVLLRSSMKRRNRFISHPAQVIASCPWNWERIDGNKWQNILTKEVMESKHNPEFRALTWKTLTYHDWSTIIGSMLVTASNPHFFERFGREKMELERLLLRHNLFSTCMAECQTPAEEKAKENIQLFSAGTYVDGKFVPNEPLKYNFVVQVVAPERILDHSHWGYLIWKFCKFMDSVDHPSL